MPAKVRYGESAVAATDPVGNRASGPLSSSCDRVPTWPSPPGPAGGGGGGGVKAAEGLPNTGGGERQAAERGRRGRLGPLSQVQARGRPRCFPAPPVRHVLFAHEVWSQTDTSSNPALPLASLASAYKVLDLAGPQFIHPWTGVGCPAIRGSQDGAGDGTQHRGCWPSVLFWFDGFICALKAYRGSHKLH